MTARQFYLMLCIFVISVKVQKVPCLMHEAMGKDFYLLIIPYFLVNLLFIFLVFFILKSIKHKKAKLLLHNNHHWFVHGIKWLFMIATAFYFVVQGLMLYEHIQALFANTLFDNISWPIFSLLMLFAVVYLAHTQIQNIAYTFELYFWVIILPLVALTILGVTKTDFSSVLPFETINVSNILSKYVNFNLWFGDYFIILYMGYYAKDIKLSKTVLFYSISIVFVVFVYIVFGGIYLDYTPVQSSLIGAMSDQSLIGLDVGRFDWFLILFSEIGAILSCSACLFFANRSLMTAFPKIKQPYIEIFLAVILYVMDIVFLDDLQKKEIFFVHSANTFAEIVKIGTIIFLGVVCTCILLKNRKKKYERIS